MFDQNFILVVFLTSIALANRALYYYDDGNNKRKRIDSLKSFSYIHKYLRYSTFTIAILSIYSSSQFLYDILGSEYIYIGASLCGISTVLLLIARYNLNENYSPCYDMKAPKDFVQHGIYAIVRHPIYLSNIILLFGVFLISGSAWLLFNLSILFSYYLISAIKEERYLNKRFPGYKNYKSSTSMFIPGYKLLKK